MYANSNLSHSDNILMNSLTTNSILGEMSREDGHLFYLHKLNKTAEDAKRMEPYADILEDELVAMLKAGKDNLVAELKKCKSADIQIPLFNWNTVIWHESLHELNSRRAKMTAEERKDSHETKWAQEEMIDRNKWETKFSVINETLEYDASVDDMVEYFYHTYYPMKVDRIFKQTDLAQRLALALGPNFSTYTRTTSLENAGDKREIGGFSVLKKTLYLKYHPYGLPYNLFQPFLQIAKVQEDRKNKGERTVLKRSEKPFGADLLRLTPSA